MATRSTPPAAHPDDRASGNGLEILAAVIEGAVDAIVAIDEDGTILLANPACERLLGYTPHELRGKDVGMLMPSPHREEHPGYVRRYLRTGERRIIGIGREVEALSKDGSRVWVHLAVSEIAVGGRRIFAGFFRDLTDQKAAEAALRESRAELASILESAADAIITIDEKGSVLSMNPAGERMFGYGADEVIGRNVSMLMPSTLREEHDAFIGAYLRTRQKRIIGIGREVEGRRKDGSLVPLEAVVSEVALGDRRIFTGILRDISDRKRSEQQIEQERDRAQKYLDIAAVIMLALDTEGTVLLINRKGSELLGYEEREIVGKNWFDTFIPAALREEIRRVFRKVLRGELETSGSYENPVLTRDGRELVIEWHNTCIRNEEGEIVGTLSSGSDVTERRMLTQKLVERESLVKLGEMSMMVAHEVKNPLAGILGATRMLKKRLAENSVEEEICDEMIARTMALNDTVKDILTFARPKTPTIRGVSLRAILDDVAALVSQDPSFDSVELRISGPDPEVLCDAEMIKPVFLNILVNAAEAMGGEGAVSISVEIERGGPGGDRCRVAFHDTGPGIPPDAREHIFEPFFTTKGSGTGLGLPIARRLVEINDGVIAVECPPEGGTRVTISLPAPPPRS